MITNDDYFHFKILTSGFITVCIRYLNWFNSEPYWIIFCISSYYNFCRVGFCFLFKHKEYGWLFSQNKFVFCWAKIHYPVFLIYFRCRATSKISLYVYNECLGYSSFSSFICPKRIAIVALSSPVINWTTAQLSQYTGWTRFITYFYKLESLLKTLV